MNIKYSLKYSNPAYKDLVKNIDKLFEDSSELLFSGRNQLKIVRFNNENFVVKSFKRPNIIRSYIYNNILKSKAEKSFDNSTICLQRNIDTPQPIGFLCIAKNFKLSNSFFVSSQFKYDFDLRTVFEDFHNYKDIVRDFISFVYNMHENNVYHHDLTRGNILVSKHSNKTQLKVVDTNRMSFLKMNLEMRMESLSKISNNHEELNFIAKYYSDISNFDIGDCKKFIFKGFNKSQNYKKAKKILKGK